MYQLGNSHLLTLLGYRLQDKQIVAVISHYLQAEHRFLFDVSHNVTIELNVNGLRTLHVNISDLFLCNSGNCH